MHKADEYFEADIEIKTEIKEENNYGDETESMKNDKYDDNTVRFKSNNVKSEKGFMVCANIKEKYFEDDTKPKVASPESQDIKTEFKEETHYEDDNKSMKQEECDIKTEFKEEIQQQVLLSSPSSFIILVVSLSH